MRIRVVRWTAFLMIMAHFVLATNRAVSAPVEGIPQIDPDYSGDVRRWWATHPMNPVSKEHLQEVTSPRPTVSLAAGSDLQTAIDQLPATGGTIRLAAGVYEPFKLIGRSNIHILGPDQGEAIVTGHSYIAVCPEAMDYVKFDATVSHFDKYTYKDQRVWNLYRQPTRNFYLKNLVFDGQGTTVVDFPGVGIKGLGGGLGLKGVRDVLVDRCTFRHFLDAQGGLQHGGVAWGHYGLTNVWFRDCQFLGKSRYAVYFDGAHACGLVGCTIDCQGFKDGGLLFLANHDFTDDRNENGKLDADEEKCAKFLVIANNTFANANSTPIRLTGQNCLVQGNTALGRMLEFVGVYPVGEVAHRNWKAGEFKIRVIDNHLGTCARGVLNVFVKDADALKEVEESPLDAQYTVDGNTVEKSPELVKFTRFK